MTDDRSEFDEARQHGLKARHETRVERAIAREAIERSAAVYVLREFEALMRSRIDSGKGAFKERAELNMAIIATLWDEAAMNGYEGTREVGSSGPQWDRFLDLERVCAIKWCDTTIDPAEVVYVLRETS